MCNKTDRSPPSSPRVISAPSSPATAVAVSIGTGSSPRIIPRPEYPSCGLIAWQFVNHYVFHQSLLGAFLVHWLKTFYTQSRSLALNYKISDALYFAISLSCVHTGMYLVVNLPYILCDTLKIQQSAKLYRKPYMEPKPDLLRRLGLEQALGHLIVGPLMSYILYPILFRPFLLDFDLGQFPTFQESFATIMFYCILNDFLFYWLHRALHSKILYKHIHKQHHEFTGSVGYAAEYSHPLENVMANELPVVAGILLVKCHLLLFLVWVGIRLHETYEGHSGYCYLLLETISAKQEQSKTTSSNRPAFFVTRAYQIAHHDYHHTHNQGNFGSFWMDWIFGTMDHYQSISGFDGYMSLKNKNLTRDENTH